MTILESTLNYQSPTEDNLEICTTCKDTIIPFYLIKIKYDEACQIPENTYNDYQENSTADYTESDDLGQLTIKQEFDDDTIEAGVYQTPLEPKKKKKRPERIQWNERQNFLSADEAIEFVRSQKIWSVKHTKPVSKSGEKRQYFRCNLVPKAQARQCSAVMALVTKSDGSTLMLQSAQDHDHFKIKHELKTE